MRAAIAALIVVAATPAHAERCEVSIVRAPEDVRAQIEAWVRAEPRCATAMEIRVVPTEGGLYLFARDGRGYTRERVVPDGQTAGALVASWVADDSIDGQWLPDDALAAPGMQDALPTTRRFNPHGLGIAMGGYAGASDEGPIAGMRADIEVPLGPRSPTGSAWLLVGSLGIGGASFNGMNEEQYVHVEAHEARATLGIGRLWSGERWQLRARVGLLARLLRRTTETIYLADTWEQMFSGAQAAALYGGEAAVMVGRKLGSRWAIGAGPIVGKDAFRDGLPNVSYAPEVTFYGGVTYTQ